MSVFVPDVVTIMRWETVPALQNFYYLIRKTRGHIKITVNFKWLTVKASDYHKVLLDREDFLEEVELELGFKGYVGFRKHKQHKLESLKQDKGPRAEQSGQRAFACRVSYTEVERSEMREVNWR